MPNRTEFLITELATGTLARLFVTVDPSFAVGSQWEGDWFCTNTKIFTVTSGKWKWDPISPAPFVELACYHFLSSTGQLIAVATLRRTLPAAWQERGGRFPKFRRNDRGACFIGGIPFQPPDFTWIS